MSILTPIRTGTRSGRHLRLRGSIRACRSCRSPPSPGTKRGHRRRPEVGRLGRRDHRRTIGNMSQRGVGDERKPRSPTRSRFLRQRQLLPSGPRSQSHGADYGSTEKQVNRQQHRQRARRGRPGTPVSGVPSEGAIEGRGPIVPVEVGILELALGAQLNEVLVTDRRSLHPC